MSISNNCVLPRDWTQDSTTHWHACTRCKEKKDTADHILEQKTNDTNHRQECSVCGYKKDETAHSWSDWTLTTESTLNITGTAERACDCGKKQIKSDITSLSDTTAWTMDNRTNPTLTNTGNEEYTSEYGTVTVTIPALNDTGVWTKDDTKHDDL